MRWNRKLRAFVLTILSLAAASLSAAEIYQNRQEANKFDELTIAIGDNPRMLDLIEENQALKRSRSQSWAQVDAGKFADELDVGALRRQYLEGRETDEEIAARYRSLWGECLDFLLSSFDEHIEELARRNNLDISVQKEDRYLDVFVTTDASRRRPDRPLRVYTFGPQHNKVELRFTIMGIVDGGVFVSNNKPSIEVTLDDVTAFVIHFGIQDERCRILRIDPRFSDVSRETALKGPLNDDKRFRDSLTKAVQAVLQVALR
jgi:hypothetical protein